MRTLRLLVLSLALLGAAPASFTPYLVKDIRLASDPGSSNPEGFTPFGRLTLFQISGDRCWCTDRAGLWRSDGTASGTFRLMEAQQVVILGVAGDRAFFHYQDESYRWLLGVTDGTLRGTLPLVETLGSEELPGAWVPEQKLFYFSAEIPGGGHGVELWRSDGTPGGTYEVTDLAPGPDSSRPHALTAFHGRLYFAAGSTLWRSDGTAAGTVRIRDVEVRSSLQAVGSRLVFAGLDPEGAGLWASDGTPGGTRRIVGLFSYYGQPSFENPRVVRKRLFFFSRSSVAGPENLWVTDGTPGGTRKLTSFSNPDYWLAYPVASLGNRLFFWASDRAHSVDLWESDGTPKGTRRVLQDLCPNNSCLDFEASPLLSFRDRIYFRRQNGTFRPQLWTTDGTASGTRMVKDMPWTQEGPYAMGSSADRLFFAMYTSPYGYDSWSAAEVWATDGTTEGTVLLAEPWGRDFLIEGTVNRGVLFFSGQDDDTGVELWRSDGTPAGTQLVLDIANEDLGGSFPHGLMPMGESVLFFARDDQSYGSARGYGLWRSDGTEEGTLLLKRGMGTQTLWTSSANRVFFVPDKFRESLWTSDGTVAGTYRLTPSGVHCQKQISAPVLRLGSRVFFSAWSPTSGAEPWVTDGTPAGTRLLADLVPGRSGSYPTDFMVSAGKVWFSANLHLWKSDGTAGGTVALGPALQDLHPRTTFSGRVWFTGTDSKGLTELWATDGTAGRTGRIAVLKTVESLTVHAGRLWFLGDGRELWSTDGTAAGTRKLVLPADSFHLLMSDGARLYLADSQPALWVSDGTAGGTRKISDTGTKTGPWTSFSGRLYYISETGDFYTSDGTSEGTRPVRPDGEPRYARSLIHFGGRLVVGGYSGLWTSDGTEEGTRLLTASGIWEIAKAGPRLFFPLSEAATGRELWALHE